MNAEAAGARMDRETLEQPAVLRRLLDEGRGEIDAVAARVREFAPHTVILAGRGTSDHAALYAKYLIEVSRGLPCGLASPSTLTSYDASPRYDGVLWVVVSQSGGSPDLVESTRVAGEHGALTVAVTNAPGSALAAAAALHVDVRCGPELSVAATKSYTAQLLALWLLVDAWRGGDGKAAEVVPDGAAEVLGRPEIREVAARFRFVDRLVTTGRGYAYPTAREAALKLMETSYLSAHAFSGADLMHGPFAMIDEDRPVVVVVPPAIGGAALLPVLDRLHERGADVTVVGDTAAAPWAAAAIPVPEVPEELAPVLQIMPLQRLALAMALARGHDPDAPRGLRKVTETR